MASLGAVGSHLGHFLEPLGQLGHQKSPKGGPKAPKRPRRNPQIAAPGAFLGAFLVRRGMLRISKKCKKTVPKSTTANVPQV